MSDYEDIIHLPHHTSRTRPRMPMIDRAAQFAPFAALTGYDAVIRETGRLTDRRIELSEDGRAELDGKLRRLAERIPDAPEVTVTCFVPDERKNGGAYAEIRGRARRIDRARKVLILADGTRILLRDILDISL